MWKMWKINLVTHAFNFQKGSNNSIVEFCVRIIRSI